MLTCYWEPRPPRAVPNLAPGTAAGFRHALDGLRAKDRGRAEKRVIKVAVWGMESDAEAQSAFTELIGRVVKKT